MNQAAHLILYGHDTFGLGHIRRNRKIASALVDCYGDIRVTIITGSGLSGEYASHPRIDYVEIPPVEKLPDGRYQSGEGGLSYAETIAARTQAIGALAQSQPADIFIADKEPLGLGGELSVAIKHFKASGTTMVLGLRDVLDDAVQLKKEWQKKGYIGALDNLYDQIWIYGSEQFYKPLEGLGLPEHVLEKCQYTGFLYQPNLEFDLTPAMGLPKDYLLVTTGGGGDGDPLMDAVLNAYENGSEIPCPSVLLLGPYSDSGYAEQVKQRAAGIDGIHVIGFDSEPEVLIRNARAVIGMCGYNTFCEVIARNKPVLFVPRQMPRMEQFIRANRAKELGYCDVILSADAANPDAMAHAIRQLIDSSNLPPAIHDFDAAGLEYICGQVGSILEERRQETLKVEPAL